MFTQDVWTELRARRNNLTRRSGHQLIFYKNRLYLFGGFELDNEILGDLLSISYQDGELGDSWTTYEKSPYQPEALVNYISCQYEGVLFINGGLSKATHIQKTSEWLQPIQSITPNFINITIGQREIKVHSHGGVLIIDNWYSLFGFVQNETGCIFSNSIRKMDLRKPNLGFKIITDMQNQLIPEGRINFASCQVNNSIIIHGGINSMEQVLSDCWRFKDLIWTRLYQDDEIYRFRHTINTYEDILLIFGGSDQYQKETSDIYCILGNHIERIVYKEDAQSISSKLRAIKSVNRYKSIQYQQKQPNQQKRNTQLPLNTSHSILNGIQKDQSKGTIADLQQSQSRDFELKSKFSQLSDNSIESSQIRQQLNKYIQLSQPSQQAQSLRKSQDAYDIITIKPKIKHYVPIRTCSLDKLPTLQKNNEKILLDLNELKQINEDIKPKQTLRKIKQTQSTKTQFQDIQLEKRRSQSQDQINLKKQSIIQRKSQVLRSVNISQDSISTDQQYPKYSAEQQLQEIKKKLLYQSLLTPIDQKNRNIFSPHKKSLTQRKKNQDMGVTSPTTTNMKNILIQVTNLGTWKQYIENFMMNERQEESKQDSKLQIANTKQFHYQARIKGKKVTLYQFSGSVPIQRDGHASCLVNDRLVILGGDRKKLTFNDVFEINLQNILSFLQENK